MKIGEQTLSDGKVVEIHRCDFCGDIHVGEKTSLGFVVIPCPKMDKMGVQVEHLYIANVSEILVGTKGE